MRGSVGDAAEGLPVTDREPDWVHDGLTVALSPRTLRDGVAVSVVEELTETVGECVSPTVWVNSTEAVRSLELMDRVVLLLVPSDRLRVTVARGDAVVGVRVAVKDWVAVADRVEERLDLRETDLDELSEGIKVLEGEPDSETETALLCEPEELSDSD